MKTLSRTRFPKNDRQKGFALLITITLLAFLVLLLVSLASLTRVETQVASNSQQLSLARQNALLALNVAIGQLQAAVGPDQRVTARAEILDSTVNTLAADGIKQPFWTGVWKSGPIALDPSSGTGQREISTGETAGMSRGSKIAAAKAKAQWLVSSDQGGTNPDPSLGTDLTIFADSVTGVSSTSLTQSGVALAAAGTTPTGVVLAKSMGLRDPSAPTSTANQPYVVAAPLVKITTANSTIPGLGSSGTSTIGRYGYWVSDEGLKAKVNLTDDTMGAASGSVQEQVHLSAPQANAVHKITDLMSSSTADFRTVNTSEQIKNLIQPSSLKFLPSVSPTVEFSKLLPDVTTYGATVFSDVRNGGLKKDLTAAFESADEYDNFLSYARALTRGDAGDGSARADNPGDERVFRFPLKVNANHSDHADITGLRWLSLYNYYNLYKSTYDLYPYSGITRGPKINVNYSGLGAPSQTSLNMRIRGYSYSSGVKSGVGYADPIMPIAVGTSIYIGFSTERLTTAPSGAPAAAPGQSYFRVRLHMIPQITLWNPYNVKLTLPAGVKLKYTFTSNVLTGPNSNGPRWTVTAGTKTIMNDKSIVWDGSTNKYPTPVPNLTVETSENANIELESGQLKVYGMRNPVQGTSVVNAMNITGLLNDSVPGVGRWAYLKGETATENDAIGWYGLLSDSESLAVVWTESGRFNSNNGRVKVKLNNTNSDWHTGDWPKTAGSSEYTRTYLSTVNTIPVADRPQVLGTFLSLDSGIPKAIKTVAQINMRARGASSSDASKIPIFESAANLFNPLTLDRDSAVQEVNFGFAASSPASSPPENAISLDSTGEATTFFGKFSSGANAADLNKLVLKEIPRSPLISLGQFRHLDAFYSFPNIFSVGLGFIRSTVLYPVGSSRSHAYVPSGECAVYDSTGQSAADLTPTLITDDNYLSNDVLFDRYFLSSVPGAYQDDNSANYYPFTKFTDAYIAAGGVLPNNRITYNTVSAPTAVSLRKFDTAAVGLLLNGGFNINSTSVEAWKAFLASTSGVTPSGVSSSDSPYSRFANTNGFNVSRWGGISKLGTDATDLTPLAKAIVEEIKTRGPFLSLGDFLNRRLGTLGTSRSGALQAAIDNVPSLNTGLIAAGGVSATVSTPAVNNHSKYVFQPAGVKDSQDVVLNTASGAPGHLTQGDLVQALAPGMTARSDTFVIRVYGDSVNPVVDPNNPVASAYAEAVVQRLPEYVDTSDSPEKWGDLSNYDSFNPSVAYTISTINQNFGRRFRVISFRWLSKNDL